jgi:hypothetical protein
MRSHRSRSTWRVWTLGVLTLVLIVAPQAMASAQQSIDPTATPVRETGGWVYWMAEGAIVLGGLIVLLAVASYLRFAPRFYRSDRDEEAKQTAVPAPPATAVRLQYRPPPQPAAAPTPEPAAVGAPAGAVTAPAAAPAAAPATAAAPGPAAAPAATPTTEQAAPRPATPRHEGPVELDQETFDRVLKEQLDKGTDRRVAEGRARSAAFKAAREKAGG